MKSNTIILILAGILIAIGLLKPNFNQLVIPNRVVPNAVEIAAPTDENLFNAANKVIKALSNDADRKYDGKRLSELYLDIATLISLDGENVVIKTTEEIGQANALSGIMLKLDIKNKYPELASAAKEVIVAGIGDDNLELNPDLRNKAVESFKALAWACQEGSK